MFKHICIFILLIISLPIMAQEKTSKLRVCAVYPHLKDSYWLSINFGMTNQAKLKAINLKVLESGGYNNHDEQWQQIEKCLTFKADAILIGAIYFESVSEQLELINLDTPIFGLVNELSATKLVASTGVSWSQMGFKLGEYLAKKHPKGSKPVTLAWLPGPKSGGGTPQASQGLITALKNSSVELVTTQYGLNEKISQFALINQTLKNYPNIDYLAGNAVMAEMAISEVANLTTPKKPQILSHYFSHGVYRGIRRGKILMANSDQMVNQGKMAINQVVDFLQGRDVKYNQGPEILSLNQNNINNFDVASSLSPSDFKPLYSVGDTH